MSAERHLCNHCFKLLDPNDARPDYAACVRCADCGKEYHQACWAIFNACQSCQGTTAELLLLANPSGISVPTRNREPLILAPIGGMERARRIRRQQAITAALGTVALNILGVAAVAMLSVSPLWLAGLVLVDALVAFGIVWWVRPTF